MKAPDALRRLAAALAALPLLAALLTVAPALAQGATPVGQDTIAQLNHIAVVASTVDAINGDTNPYGLALVPDTPAIAKGAFVERPGDLLVTNFSDAKGVNGAGTTVERLHRGANGKWTESRFFGAAQGPVAIAVSPLGPPWIADFTSNEVQVITPNGTQFKYGQGDITRSGVFAGPWGQAFGKSTAGVAMFFSTNVLTGTVDRITGFVPGKFASTAVVAQVGSGLRHSGRTAADAVGPQGLAYNAATDTLYVTDGADNSVHAYPHVSTSGDQGRGVLVYRGAPLNQPAGLAINPLNGDLLVVNQGNNNLVELSLSGRRAHPVAVRRLDPTPVNPRTGAGSALFGLVATKTPTGHLVVYFTDDNTNTVDVLERSYKAKG